jgi:hypothetical protein
MIAWHGSHELKARVMARLREHWEQDEFIRGLYQEIDPIAAAGYRGCAIGCTLPLQSKSQETLDDISSWHRRVEELYGISAEVAWVIDNTFESLESTEEAADFAVAVVEAIPVGALMPEDGDLHSWLMENWAPAPWGPGCLANLPRTDREAIESLALHHHRVREAAKKFIGLMATLPVPEPAQ